MHGVHKLSLESVAEKRDRHGKDKNIELFRPPPRLASVADGQTHR